VTWAERGLHAFPGRPDSRLRALMRRLGREAEFASHLASLRVAHKPKRNFIAMLDRATWD